MRELRQALHVQVTENNHPHLHYWATAKIHLPRHYRFLATANIYFPDQCLALGMEKIQSRPETEMVIYCGNLFPGTARKEPSKESAQGLGWQPPEEARKLMPDRHESEDPHV